VPPESISAWGKWLAQAHMPLTCAAYRTALRRYLIWCQKSEIAPLAARSSDVAAYRDALSAAGYHPQSIRLNLSALRAFYSWARDEGLQIAHPVEGVRVLGARAATTAHKRSRLSAEEVRRLLSTCNADPAGSRDRAMLSLMLYCALRMIELQRAEVGDLERREGESLLWVWGKGRSGPDEYVVLPAPAEEALQAWLGLRPRAGGALFISLSPRSYGRPLGLAYVRKMIRARYRRAGIADPHITPHSLRDTAISAAIDGGATPLQAQAMARHGDVRTTLGYYHEKDRLRSPAEKRISYAAPEQ
jgi:site-specific recombinase XerD